MKEPSDRPKLVIEPLDTRHDRRAFSCGVAILDSYLYRQATQDVRKRVAVVLVATPDSKSIAGFYTLSQFAIELDVIPEEIVARLPRYRMVPTTLIGRLSVSKVFQGQGLGEFMLMDALYRSLTGSRILASAGVAVDAINGAAVAFYRKYGFLDLPKIPRRLFLPMGTIETMFRRK